MSAAPLPSSGAMLVQGPHPVLVPVGGQEALLRLDRPVTLAGSGTRCRLHLQSGSVSKVHVAFVRDGYQVVVRDLASREGVYVDGELVRERLLSGGERLLIGRFEFVFESAPAAVKLARRAPVATLDGIELESRTFIVGRRETCDLSIPRPEVSAAHAAVIEIGGHRYLRDLGSRTGVRVNGSPAQWERLSDGDVIEIAGRLLTFREEAPVTPEPLLTYADVAEEEAVVLATTTEPPADLAATADPATDDADSHPDDLLGSPDVAPASPGSPEFLPTEVSAPGPQDGTTGVMGPPPTSRALNAARTLAVPGTPIRITDDAAAAGLTAPVAPPPTPPAGPSEGDLLGSPDDDASLSAPGPAVTLTPDGPDAGTPVAVGTVTFDLDPTARVDLPTDPTAPTAGLTGTVAGDLTNASVTALPDAAGLTTPASLTGQHVVLSGIDLEDEWVLRPDPMARSEAAELGRVLREEVGMPEFVPEPLPEPQKPVVTVAKWLGVLAVSAAVGAGVWSLTAPEPLVRGVLRVSTVSDPRPLLTAEGVREAAIERLALTNPGLPPGELSSNARIAEWAEAAAQPTPGITVIEVPGRREQAARLKALLETVADRVLPTDNLTPDQRLARANDQLTAADDAVRAARERLDDLEVRTMLGERLTNLNAALTRAVRDRELASERLRSVRADVPETDLSARRALDSAVAAFRAQLDEARRTDARPALAAFADAAKRLGDDAAALTDAIVTRRRQEADRLRQLKDRLAERMRVRQMRAWEQDEELKRTNRLLESTRKRLEGAEPTETALIQDLNGEIEYLEGLAAARRLLLGTDRGDQAALREIDAIIAEHAEGASRDRQLLDESFARMRESLAAAMPESLPDDQRRSARLLEARLEDLQSARAALAASAAEANRRYQQTISEAEAAVARAEKMVVDTQLAVAETRARIPTPTEVEDLRRRVDSLLQDRDAAGRALQFLIDRNGRDPSILDPEVATTTSDPTQRPLFSALAASLTLLFLSPLTRGRK